MVFPPPLQPGDRIAVVAPAGGFPRDELLRGLAWLRARFELAVSPSIFDREGYLAGTDARRAGELTRAVSDDRVKAIVAVRGGYGAMRVLDTVPWQALALRPKWLVGFSDITALHVMAARVGVASVHGPNVTGLGREVSAAVKYAWLECIERPTVARVWRGLDVIRRGEAKGRVAGGNLSLLHAMAACGRLTIPRGAILLLEDVSESPYRVDRMLTSLRLGGQLASVSAVVFGAFDRCNPGPDATTVEHVLAERTHDLGVPVLAGAPFGHIAGNEAFVLGSTGRVVGNRLELG